MSGRLVQYVVVLGDLQSGLGWPLGALVAQACHACTAALHLYYAEADTQRYLGDLDSMHKVVLQADDKDALTQLSEKLTVENIQHKLWVEQPENIPTCLALRPYPKEQVHHLLKKFKLLK
ncbi:putative peptidyl-tRNA hydrolase PTRHD1 [Petromyzon marinus]|nr:putative peptidyl-tRNA hydrolase PTRHD1 [Petromyzon marinus]XP_032828143.1 putative peptidyl-tRNA hydrolase PTRHD1 [Petromyzon marinus]